MGEITDTLLGRLDEVYIKNNKIYYPLLFYPDRNENSKEIITTPKGKYILGLDISDVIENYKKLDEETYSKIKKSTLDSIFNKEDINNIFNQNDYHILKTLIFDVMPYFTRIGTGKFINLFKKEKKSDDQITEILREKLPEIRNYDKNIIKLYKIEEKKEVLKNLNVNDNISIPEGFISKNNLNKILSSSIRDHILKNEKENLLKDLDFFEEEVKKDVFYFSTLMYLKEKRSFELNNFGFKINNDTIIAYIQLDSYALKDFDESIYLFPPCKVGIAINRKNTSLGMPFVLDKYKHPFLKDYSFNQNICIKNFNLEGRNLKERIIDSLQKGANTILHGYHNENNFNGYHTLDGLTHHGDPPRIDFDDLKISKNDSRIKSGEVKITNEPFIKR